MDRNITAARGEAGDLRVLLAEDEMLIALDMKEALARLGCRVVATLPTLDRVMQAIIEEPLDGAVLDVDLAGQSIAPATRALEQRGIPFILATGYDPSGLPAEFTGRPCLVKPVAPRDLAAEVRRVFLRRP